MTFTESKVSFGTALRCARLGYHPMADVGMVRILADGPPHVVQVVPFGYLPVEHGKTRHSKAHVRWWEGDARIVEGAIRPYFRAHPALSPVELLLDDAGKLISPATSSTST